MPSGHGQPVIAHRIHFSDNHTPTDPPNRRILANDWATTAPAVPSRGRPSGAAKRGLPNGCTRSICTHPLTSGVLSGICQVLRGFPDRALWGLVRPATTLRNELKSPKLKGKDIRPIAALSRPAPTSKCSMCYRGATRIRRGGAEEGRGGAARAGKGIVRATVGRRVSTPLIYMFDHGETCRQIGSQPTGRLPH